MSKSLILIPSDRVMSGILVVGAGSMGWNHARVCHELGVLTGICDRDKNLVDKVANKFEVKGFTNLEDALEEIKPHGVIIATPTSTHYEVATLAIKNGMNVLVEKPLTKSIDNGNKLVKLARKTGVILAVGHIERHNPVITKAKIILKNKEWGDIITISSRRVSNFPGRISDVGVILDLGIHDIDNVIHLMDSRPISVFTKGGKYHDIKYEDHATIMIGFENGKSALVEVNWITPMKVRTLSLTCEKSFVVLDYIKQNINISSSRFVDTENPNQFPTKMEIYSKEMSLNFTEPLKLEIKNFIDAIENNVEPLVNGEDALISLKVTIAAIKSLETGGVVNID
jgi:UDP-N-acetylglucosamine 3-dehydrogenase